MFAHEIYQVDGFLCCWWQFPRKKPQPRKSVVHIHSTYGAFAAILEGGTVVTWGYPSDGGDSSDVVQQLHSVARAMVAVTLQ